MCAATCSSCVTIMIVVPCFWLRSESSFTISCLLAASKLPVGSSAKIMAGSVC